MNKYKITVAGCGNMAKKWIEYAVRREDAEIISLVDISRENAAGAAGKYSLSCRIFNDLRQAVLETRPDLVFDITVPESHKNIVTTALQSGCHVFGEKPMANSMAEAREMVAAAEKYGKTYAVMQNRRYLKNIRAFRDVVASGTIGRPGFVCADFFLGPHFGGFRDVMDSPLLLDMAIHTFDQARFITGSDAVSVYCTEFNPAGSWYKGNAAAVCIFEMSDGAVFCYRGSWCAEGCPTSWEASWRITGSGGTAIWDGKNLPYSETVLPSAEKNFMNVFEKTEAVPLWQGREGHDGCLDEMFAALAEGRRAETDCADNIKSMAMVFGALESAKKGQKILL